MEESISKFHLLTCQTALLRHLPYIDESYEAQGTPTCYWADWQSLAANAVTYPAATGTIPNGEGLRICSEGGEASEDVPADVIGLTYGGRENKTLLLDTRLGVVYWPESDDGGNYAHNMDNDPSFIQTVWGIEDHVPENEMEWRNEPAWAVEVFFEMLKKQYRELKWIPTSARRVLASDFSFGDDQEGMIDMLRGIYREHGWGGEGYRKRECLEAVEKALKEQYPTFDEWI